MNPPGWLRPVRPRLVNSQLNVGLVGTGAGQSRIAASAAAPALDSAAVPVHPRWGLPVRAMLVPGVDHPIPQKA